MLKELKYKVRYTASKLFIRLGYIKEVAFTANEISPHINDHLPAEFSINVTAGDGKFEVHKATLTMPNDGFLIDIEAAIKVSMLGKDIYSASLSAQLTAKPHYDIDSKLIHIVGVQLKKLEILEDEFSMVKEAQESAEKMMPFPLRSILKQSIKTTTELFDLVTNSDTKKMSQLYISGNRQMILDFHKSEIEKILISQIQTENLAYPVTGSDLETQLFNELGQRVDVEKGELKFKFY